jgi:hypothetical protein
VILPGALGAAPWVALLLAVGVPAISSDFLAGAMEYKTSLLAVLLLGSTLIFGMLFREIGTYIEWQFDQSPGRGSRVQFDRDWRQFLRTLYERVPVGHRYIRITVQGMFFELSIASAFISLGVGILTCRCAGLLSGDWYFFLGILSATSSVAILALYAAQDSHEVLASTRYLLVRGLRTGDANDKHLRRRRPLNPRGPFRRFAALVAVFTTLCFVFVHAAVDSTWVACAPLMLSLVLLLVWRVGRARRDAATR